MRNEIGKPLRLYGMSFKDQIKELQSSASTAKRDE